MREVILFILSFLLVLVLYEFLIVRRAKKRVDKKTKQEKAAKEPLEVTYLKTRYKLDMEKINYSKLLQVIAFTSSFDIALIVSVIAYLNNFILEIILGFFLTIGIILLSYHLIYLFYKKKGMIQNES
ncbi:MAG: hypothetical protein IJI60_02890 [Bacilli bacterium]|nr:hypothetical protein [Bacilli bacterium]